MSSWYGEGQIYLSYILCWMYMYRQMFRTVGTAHILYFCNASCRSAENVVMMMNRTTRGHLKTVTVKCVGPTPHFLLYSSISVHCHTVNSLFRLPHSMLTVLYRNLPACHFIGEEEQFQLSGSTKSATLFFFRVQHGRYFQTVPRNSLILSSETNVKMATTESSTTLIPTYQTSCQHIRWNRYLSEGGWLSISPNLHDLPSCHNIWFCITCTVVNPQTFEACTRIPLLG